MNPHLSSITSDAASATRSKSAISGFLILILALLSATCAKVVAPPGGPEDKTPPTVLSATPHSHQTKVPPGNSFVVSFSENIDPRSVNKQFFVSPRQVKPPKIKIHGAELEAVFVDSFSLDQTYVITLGSGIRDMRGNQLEDSKSFAFTRGEEIDTSFVSGTVTSGDSPASGVAVALFRNFTPSAMGEMDSLYPDYFTMSGSDGSFELAFLPVDDYFILAFKDKDNNQLFQYGAEDFGVTTRELHIGSDEYDNLELRMQEVDTSETTIITALFNTDKALKVNLSRKLSPSLFSGGLEHVRLLSAADSSLVSTPTALKNPTGEKTKRFEFYFNDLPAGDYLFSLGFDSLYSDGRDAQEQIIEVSYSDAADTRTPSIEGRVVPEIIAPWETPQWTYIFSEPVSIDTNQDSSIVLTNSRQGRANYVVSQPVAPNELVIIASIRPVKGERYTLTIDTASIRDFSGNAISDSVLFDSISVWSTDSLGLLTLNIDNRFDSLYDGSYFLRISRLKGRDYWIAATKPDSISMELPAGDYIIEALTDTSRNSVGSLYPLRFAKPRSFYPDTVNVRPRFDTEGITIILE